MKKHLQLSAILLAIGAILFAQEKTEVTVTVKKDGKIVKDTTYAFEDAKKAKKAVHMVDVMASGKDEMMFKDKEHNVFIKKMDGDHKKHMMFVSEDGEITELKGDPGEHGVVWVEEGEDGSKKVIIKKIAHEDCEHAEKHDHGKDCEHAEKKIIKKELIMISEEEGEGDWTIKEVTGEDGEVIIIKKKKGDGDEEEIEVEVITKEKEKQKKMVKKEKLDEEKKKKKEK